MSSNQHSPREVAASRIIAVAIAVLIGTTAFIGIEYAFSFFHEARKTSEYAFFVISMGTLASIVTLGILITMKIFYLDNKS